MLCRNANGRLLFQNDRGHANATTKKDLSRLAERRLQHADRIIIIKIIIKISLSFLSLGNIIVIVHDRFLEVACGQKDSDLRPTSTYSTLKRSQSHNLLTQESSNSSHTPPQTSRSQLDPLDQKR